MATINSEFADGRPSKQVARSGVLARFFDPSEDPDAPWLPCGMRQGAPDWCRIYGDRMPASLISRRYPQLYAKGDSMGAGFLVEPSAASLLCAYPMDGSTMNKNCLGREHDMRECTPGCPSRDATGRWTTEWCRWGVEPASGACAWRPDQLDSMFNDQFPSNYNEIVLDAKAWTRHMPHTIRAVRVACPPHTRAIPKP